MTNSSKAKPPSRDTERGAKARPMKFTKDNSRRYFIGDSYALLFPPHRNEHRRFVICVRDAEKPVNAFLLQPLAYRLLQYAPVGAMKYLHFHLQRFS